MLSGDSSAQGGNADTGDLDVFVNLLSSGNAALWVAYTWDAENRLVGVEPAGTPKSGDVKVGFVYDYMGGRVQKKVWTHNGSSWGDPTEHRKFVWNGWLLLMELDGLNDDAVLRKRTWGLDLAGLTGGASSVGPASGRSMLEGAGGIGGLLAVYDTNGTTTGENPEADDMAYVYFYDANGNVGQVVDLSHTPGDPAGAIVARYEYDPYGNVTSQSGAYAAANPFRFSTKYFDDETGLGYWGYRYYDPKLGRWVSRDPIGEAGGVNEYCYAFNVPIGHWDALGEFCGDCCPPSNPADNEYNKQFVGFSTAKAYNKVGQTTVSRANAVLEDLDRLALLWGALYDSKALAADVALGSVCRTLSRPAYRSAGAFTTEASAALRTKINSLRAAILRNQNACAVFLTYDYESCDSCFRWFFWSGYYEMTKHRRDFPCGDFGPDSNHGEHVTIADLIGCAQRALR